MKTNFGQIALCAAFVLGGPTVGWAQKQEKQEKPKSEKQEKVPVKDRRGGDTVGNGGNFNELTFTAMAYEFYEALVFLKARAPLAVPVNTDDLKRVISTATIKGLNEALYLRGDEKHAINNPDLVLVKYNSDEWKNAPFLRRKQMVAHELLPMVGIPDPGYHLAIRLIRQVDSHGLWADRIAPRSAEVTTLFSRFDDNTRTGYSLKDASQTCQQIKEQYESTYFAVYCEFIEKTYGQWVPVDQKRVEKQFRRSEAKNPPVSWEEAAKTVVEVQTITRHFEESSVYGLKVIGLGLMSQLPWKVLFTSRNYGEGFGSRAFTSRISAMSACRDLIHHLDFNSLRYYKATCRTTLDAEEDMYYYEIVTKNPLATQSYVENRK